MRLLILSFFFLLLGCNTYFKTEKIYICGDHPCKSTKEAKEYFDNNISIEIYTIETDKAKSENFDLVELNLLENKLKSKEKIVVSDDKKDLNRIIEERKKLAKLKIKKIDEPYKNKEIIDNQKAKKEKKKSKISFIRICKETEECDIDKISKIIMDIGKEKDFPKIN